MVRAWSPWLHVCPVRTLSLGESTLMNKPIVCARGAPRDRDLTVKGSRHLTFHITVKLTIKEEMLNLTCRQTFSFVATHLQGAHALELEEAAHPPPTRHGPAAAPRSSALRSTPSTMPPPLKICTAERAVCACLKRLVSEASGPRVSGCLVPSAESAHELAESSPREL